MRVSVGISFYNNERTLADAIRSVFAQTFRDWELILIDDGSFDDSLALAQTVQDARVRVIMGRMNQGLASRLNQLAQLAHGEFIARMDADDMMHPERLERQTRYLDANPSVALVGTGAYVIDSSYTLVGLRKVAHLDSGPTNALKRGPLIHPTVTGRAGWFRRNPYDETLPRLQDRELWYRTYSQSVFAQLGVPLHFYREDASVSLERYLQSCHLECKIVSKHGPAVVGRYHTWRLLLRTYLKGEIFRVLTALGLQAVLIRIRNSPLSKSEQAIALETLNTILKTPVPGLPPGVIHRENHACANETSRHTVK